MHLQRLISLKKSRNGQTSMAKREAIFAQALQMRPAIQRDTGAVPDTYFGSMALA
jgi:hypothetical protein